MRRRMTSCAAAALVVLAAASASQATLTAHTKASVYRAFTPAGKVVPRVQLKTGYCWTSSDVTPRSDAWRCAVGNLLFDPCFDSPRAPGIVICPTPWNERAIEIRLTKPLPKPPGRSAPALALAPWALELSSGARCLLSSGASAVVHGQRLNYFCGSRAKYGLWGFPNRASQTWTILSAPFDATVLSKRVAITRAWM